MFGNQPDGKMKNPCLVYEASQVNQTYKMISDPLISDKRYDCIVVAVSHKQFKAYTSEDYSRLSSDIKVIIDIKNIVFFACQRLQDGVTMGTEKKTQKNTPRSNRALRLEESRAVAIKSSETMTWQNRIK